MKRWILTAASLIWLLSTTALAMDIRCIPEQGMPPFDVEGQPVELPGLLDVQWSELLLRVPLWAPGKLPTRPTFCFGWEKQVILNVTGQPTRILGAYDPKTNRAWVFLTPVELGKDGWCVIRHEMLHALLGHDEDKVRATQGCAVTTGGGL